MTTAPEFNVWEGVFPDIEQAPASGPGFSGDTWIGRSVETARCSLEALRAGDPINRAIRERNMILPPLLAALVAQGARVRVLDIVGGIGFGYMAAAEALPGIAAVDYTVVEVERVCEAGRAMFGDTPRFVTALPGGETFDVVYAASAMQYIRDWRGAISAFAATASSFLLISDILVGRFATYATSQNYYESRIPYWMYNRDEFVREIERNGFRLMMNTPGISTILGKAAAVPMRNFPENLRVQTASHFLFARKSG